MPVDKFGRAEDYRETHGEMRKRTDKVCVFSYRLAWKLKVILS